MSKYLITGVTGMVGSHLLDHLVTSQPDSEIIGLCRWRSPLDNAANFRLRGILIFRFCRKF